jgi:SOS response associated peptidase (SRAP)
VKRLGVRQAQSPVAALTLARWRPAGARATDRASRGRSYPDNCTLAPLCSGAGLSYVQGMCRRYTMTSPVEALRQLFMFDQRPNLMPRYNIAPTQDVPIVRLTRDGSARELITVRWGLVPFWADDLSIGNRLINARCETVHTLRAFREAYSRRRCLVPADGFFEWQKQGKLRQSFLIGRKDHAPFAFAGLWERGGNRARMTQSCGPARSSPARPTI